MCDPSFFSFLIGPPTKHQNVFMRAKGEGEATPSIETHPRPRPRPHLYPHPPTHTPSRPHPHPHPPTHTHTHTHKHTRAHARAHTHKHTRTRTHTHKRTCRLEHKHPPTYVLDVCVLVVGCVEPPRVQARPGVPSSQSHSYESKTVEGDIESGDSRQKSYQRVRGGLQRGSAKETEESCAGGRRK